jgi:hypothetical protein
MHQPSLRSVAVSLPKVSLISLSMGEYVPATSTNSQTQKCGVSSGLSSRSSSLFSGSWLALLHSKYATLTSWWISLGVLADLAVRVFCRNLRLSKNKTRSTFCPCPGRTARLGCRYRHRLRYYSAPCHQHCSLFCDYGKAQQEGLRACVLGTV